MTPAELQSRLLYRDGLMLVIDKPAGLPVHAGPGGGPNLEQFLDALRFGLPKPPALAHRLDRDTSGCLVLGRHRKALARLGRLFAEGRVDKTYWAVVKGAPAEAQGTMDLPLRKESTRRGGWRMVPDAAGQRAVTAWRVLAAKDGRAWLELSPRTGRTHQIRVHCAALGCPVLGDALYGGRRGSDPPALHLHARRIVVPLYANKPPVAVEAPPPAHMLPALRALGHEG
jgi:tRNA pseudouridine32 synthase/23S rRNA pseudouridine746 synthase/23S rRNA pseudouridine1911/1915/1917 synthase